MLTGFCLGQQLWPLSQQPTVLVPFVSPCAKPRPLKGTGHTEMWSQTCPLATPLSSRGWLMKKSQTVQRSHLRCFILHAGGTWEALKTQHNPTHPFASSLFTPRSNSCVGRQWSCYIYSLSPSCLILPSHHVSADFVFYNCQPPLTGQPQHLPIR